MIEPPTVKALRVQIARGATDSLLFRIAGSAAEFNRLSSAYGLGRQAPVAAAPLKPKPPPAAPAVDDLPERQALLLGMLTNLAEAGEVFPGVVALSAAIECSWLVVERDLSHLARKRRIRVDVYRARGGRTVRRVAIVGTALQTALPASLLGLVLEDGPNAVRDGA